MEDFLGNKIETGCRAIRCYNYYRRTEFKKCLITDIDTDREYGDSIKILTDGNSKEGWTYPHRLIVESGFNSKI